MRSTEKLTKVFEYLVNEEMEKASELMKSYILETASEIHQSIVESEEDIMEMERDSEYGDQGEDLADEIAADKEEIETEEMFGEDADDNEFDLDDDETSEDTLSLEDLNDEVVELHDEVDDLEAMFAELESDFKKVLNAEEKEHDTDFDDDDQIAGEEVMEAFELNKVAIDMKDKTGSFKSPVASQKSRIDLGGKPVKNVGVGHTGYAREDMKVGELTKHTNSVKSGKDALSDKKINLVDKAPSAGKSPAMPKK